MKAIQSLRILLLTVLLLAACQPGGPPPPTPTGVSPSVSSIPRPNTPRASNAVILDLQGAVDKRNSAQEGWTAAAVGEALTVGNQVRTGATSKVTLNFADGVITRLGPESIFTLTELSRADADSVTRLQLLAGELFIIISRSLGNGSFQVQTPVGVAAARGTLMSVRLSGQRLRVTCFETRVNCEVQNEQGKVDLQSGQQTELALNQPPTPPEKIEPEEIANWLANPEAEAVGNQDADGDDYRIIDGDCDDVEAAVHPQADDPAGDGIDQNCDGADAAQPDNDGDAFTPFEGDCNDDDPGLNPGATDTPDDGLDQNCDGQDETTATLITDPDADSDGSSAASDCNDHDPAVSPDALEIPGDGLDQNCDGKDETEAAPTEDRNDDSNDQTEPAPTEDRNGDGYDETEPAPTEDGSGDSTDQTEPAPTEDGSGDSNAQTEPAPTEDRNGDSTDQTEPAPTEDVVNGGGNN